MALRCFLFTSDDASAGVVRQALTGLGVEGESCSEAATAAERIAHELFQLVIIDWDQQPEAGMLLTTARERKAAERPLTLAIVSDDISVTKALQAGTNSILRKPILLNQAKDTLTTARDLLRARQSSVPTPLAAAAAASAATSLPEKADPGKERTLRAGEFLQSGPAAPGRQFETETSDSPEQFATEPIDQLEDLEPVAAPVPEPAHVPEAAPEADQPKTLDWYLKNRGGARQAAPAPVPRSTQPELLGYDQTPSYSPGQTVSKQAVEDSASQPSGDDVSAVNQSREQAEPAGDDDSEDRGAIAGTRFRLGKGAIFVALLLASFAVTAAPQAPWHPRMKVLWSRGRLALHVWLNPQPVTTPVAPSTHEDFGRPGDEYKLPVAENIPDATTDPSQIQVLPVVDPTKKPPADAATTEQQPPADGSGTSPIETAPAPTGQGSEVQTAATAQPAGQGSTGGTATATNPASAAAQPHSDVMPVTSAPVVPNPAPPRRPTQPQYVRPATAKVPSSLQSQMVSMTPEASGNKPPEAAMPAIEPVEVTELAERGLIIEQPRLDYPASAAGKEGTVVLQVLIGRDGTVQDARFMQGSLAFARSAIEGVRQWKFKPYTMNGRPVSVRTLLTIKFKPTQ